MASPNAPYCPTAGKAHADMDLDWKHCPWCNIALHVRPPRQRPPPAPIPEGVEIIDLEARPSPPPSTQAYTSRITPSLTLPVTHKTPTPIIGTFAGSTKTAIRDRHRSIKETKAPKESPPEAVVLLHVYLAEVSQETFTETSLLTIHDMRKVSTFTARQILLLENHSSHRALLHHLMESSGMGETEGLIHRPWEIVERCNCGPRRVSEIQPTGSLHRCTSLRLLAEKLHPDHKGNKPFHFYLVSKRVIDPPPASEDAQGMGVAAEDEKGMSDSGEECLSPDLEFHKKLFEPTAIPSEDIKAEPGVKAEQSVSGPSKTERKSTRLNIKSEPKEQEAAVKLVCYLSCYALSKILSLILIYRRLSSQLRVRVKGKPVRLRFPSR